MGYDMDSAVQQIVGFVTVEEAGEDVLVWRGHSWLKKNAEYCGGNLDRTIYCVGVAVLAKIFSSRREKRRLLIMLEISEG